MSNMNDELDRLIKDLDILRINIASMAARVESIQQSLTMLKSLPAEVAEPEPMPEPELPETDEEPVEETVPTESYESDADAEAIADTAEEEEAEDAGESEALDEPEPEIEPEQVAPVRELRRFFTINDGYRFRRELFGNSDTEMADTINMIEAMSSMAEAQDYVFSDLGWDADNEEVQEFLEIVDRYFKER